jgi:hypothetical protein
MHIDQVFLDLWFEMILMKHKDITIQPSYRMMKLLTILLLLYVIVFYSAGG